MNVPLMADIQAKGESIDVLFWVGCAGSFDDRAQKVTRAFAEILTKVGIKYAILGDEEQCTGDPARRAGNEFVFQMVALQNIETLNTYNIKHIVATCPHCFNILKNDYPALGGIYNVVHHTQFLDQLINEGKLKVQQSEAKVTYHDSCYLGRANGEYEAPRAVINALKADITEMKRSKQKGLCCGAGGAQMFKEDEPGDKRINIERVEEALETKADSVVVNCPFCMTMMSDGLKAKEKNESVMVYDISEMILSNMSS